MADRPNRRSIRMRGYDYASEGAYFVTICTDEMCHLFGRIANGTMATNELGDIAQQCWDAIPQHMPHVDIGEFVVMPNHVHGIVVIRERLVAPDGKTLDGGAAGADHDRPAMPPTTDNETPGTTPGPDTTEPREIPDGTAPLDAPERPSAMNDGSNDGHVDNVSDAPDAQRRADHDRPLRPPADPGARPPADNGTRRPMPTVPMGSLGRIVRAYKPACRQAGPPFHASHTAMASCPVAHPCGNATTGTTSFGTTRPMNASPSTSGTTLPIGGRTISMVDQHFA